MPMFEYKGIKIHWLGHDSFKIKDERTIYIDPFKIKPQEQADILLITHEHFDHLSPDDIHKVVKPETVVVAPPICRQGLSGIRYKELIIMKPGEKKEVLGVEVKAIPAYNTSKFREPGKVFHPKEEGRVGYILDVKGVKIYHAGDTDLIPEMKDLNVDVALIPVSGTYVMTSDEAVQAVAEIKPKVAIPMHYGAIVGDKRDAESFKQRAPCEVQILEKE